MTITLKECVIYPLKSGAGISVSEARVTPRGLENDRLFMLVDANGKFLTQRTLPQMALIKIAIDEGNLYFSTPARAALTMTPNRLTSESLRTEVWDSSVETFVAQDEVNAWFSDYLAQPVRLLRLSDNFVRATDPVFSKAGDQTSLADGFPFLIATQPSFDTLAAHFEGARSINRFRANLVFDGNEPFAEDIWRRVRVGAVEFDIVKHCSRCGVPNVEQETGTISRDQLVTSVLGRYRLGIDQDKPSKKAMYFGEDAVARGEGVIHVGDKVEILDEKPLDQFIAPCRLNALQPFAV